MKTRLISAFIAFSIFIPIVLMGGSIYTSAIYILSLLGLREFIKLKETKKKLPDFAKFISFVIVSLLIFNNNNNILVLSLDLRFVSLLFLSMILPVIFFHDRDKYSINDAFYLMGGVFFLGISFNMFILMRNQGLLIFAYLFLITTITDTYAFITGMLIGKTKLLESISPNKTVEGLIGGSIFGTLVAANFYITVIDPGVNLIGIYFITFFLTIVGQLGDLSFSAIKRYYGKKDFSNIMPGHGGVLDRLDSIIFVMLGFLFFIGIL